MFRLKDSTGARRATTFARGAFAVAALFSALFYSASLLLAENLRTPQGSTRNGIEALKSNSFDKAIRYFSETLSVRTDDIPALLGRAEAYRESGDVEHSLSDYANVMRLAPKNAEAYRGRSRTHDRNRNLGASIADLSQAIRLELEDRDSLWYRSQYFIHLRNHDAAVADLTAAIAIDPTVPLPYAWRARYYQQCGMTVEEQADYLFITLFAPDSLRRKLGEVACRAGGELVQAITCYTQLIRCGLSAETLGVNRRL